MCMKLPACPILVAGEINADLICQGYSEFPKPGREILVDQFSMTLGSASAICAAGLARLGSPTAFVGKVGADLWGDYCVAYLERLGVAVSRVMKDPALQTGITISVSSEADRALITYLGAIRALREEDIPDAMLAEFRHLHVSSYFLQEGLRPGLARLFGRATALGLRTPASTLRRHGGRGLLRCWPRRMCFCRTRWNWRRLAGARMCWRRCRRSKTAVP